MHDTNDVRKSKDLHDKEGLIDVDKILKGYKKQLLDKQEHGKEILIDEMYRRIERLEARLNRMEKE